MWSIGPIGFAAPWLLLGLIILPILWILLRAVPPAPIKRRFPGVVLLLGLRDDDSQSDRTPWWLLLLRLLAIAAAIVGFAGPVLNPAKVDGRSGPILIVADGTWADARNWPARVNRIEALLDNAARSGRAAALTTLTDPVNELSFQSADVLRQTMPGFEPSAWEPDAETLQTWLDSLGGNFDTFWLSDGIERESRTATLEKLETHGQVSVFQVPQQTFGLYPAEFDGSEIIVSATRTPIGNDATVTANAIGLDPAGVERQLAKADIVFEAGEAITETALALPPELRNRITRFELAGVRSAGAVALTDDGLRRREVALMSGGNNREGLELLDPLFYLREALVPSADLVDGALEDILLANPDAIIVADIAQFGPNETDDIIKWIENGGLLLRFAGPRLAASDIGRNEEDPLLPVRLRDGGRSIGGAMSWGEPKSLAAFSETSPFFGLTVPSDVQVTSQVVAQPDPTLASRVIAQLADGTPLVTRKELGQGQVVLFHVTANAEWSSLPLSGLFVQMLERLAVSSRTSSPEPADLEGTTWQPSRILDAYGRISDGSERPGIDGNMLISPKLNAELLPGLYANENRSIALNVIEAGRSLETAQWPARISVEGLEFAQSQNLKGWLIAAALLLLSIDVFASMLVGGRLRGPRADITALFLAALLLNPLEAKAQDDGFAIAATSEVVLGYVITGDARTDEISYAGLRGLTRTLFNRTSIEPAAPIGLNIETDELAFFPFLYWPITADQPLPSRDAYAKLNRYLRSGGMILFDTRDADTARFGSSSPEGRRLQAIARTLDIPALEPIPQDHVLTRTFYLLQDFPGRYNSRDIWVEASRFDAELADGMPFRNLNDGVTPVVIGGNDWARAWAVDEYGDRMFPVGRGRTGERQREIAFRFGVNLIMHVLTGNYKSDQVHVPDLLERLGQ